MKSKMLRRIFAIVVCSLLCVGRRMLWLLYSNRIAVAAASLVWLIARSATQPRRMSYPCQQAAAANVSAIAIAAAAGIAVPGGLRRRLLASRAFRFAASAGVLGLAAWLAAGVVFRPHVPLALVAQKHLADASSYAAAELSPALVYPSADEAVVSVARDLAADYPAASPYDPDGNPVYPLVRRAVAQLGLGTADQPLKGFIKPGQRVLIKPNVEGAGTFQHTHPSVVRPLIDMAAEAGAAEIIIAESSPMGMTDRALNNSGYKKMVDDLNARQMPCKLVLRNLDGTAWSWVNTGKASAYPAGEFEDEDLVTSEGDRSYHRQADSHGRNPNGRVLNQNALFDEIFDADVIINVPRLKVHGMIINTLSIKNLVGITVWSTSGSKPGENIRRVAHYGTIEGPNHMVRGFGNDILWREMANINRALIYWKNGEMKAKPQRKLLCVLDAICAGDGSHGNGPKMKVGAVLAGVDPIALDAVGSRLMRYDFRLIPVINNAPSVPSHPWGTNDPARIRLIGDSIGSETARLLSNPYEKEKEFKQLVINDIEPPVPGKPAVKEADGKQTVTVKCEGACAVFITWNSDGVQKVVRMARKGSTFGAELPDGPVQYRVAAQDRYFNSRQAGPYSHP
ncbi:MAG TPA: DUF362 domain-containing protein [Planctomycetota bacterium]|nr:DUF362 domain-containing protein [Planctomycetota bacterium]